MKKKWKKNGDPWDFRYELSQISRVMKIVFFIMLVGLTHLSASVRSQNSVVNLSLKNVSVEEALTKVEKQLKQNFFFNRESVDLERKVNLRFSNAGLDELVRELFGEDFKYRLVDNLIVISKKNENQSQPQPQSVKISGVVKDKQGTVLPGVTVLLKGTSLGVVTDVEGKFSITVPDKAAVTLIFSFVGMKTREIAVHDMNPLTVILEEEVSEMDEVVVTGYQTISREKVTGSTSSVSAKQLDERYATNLLDKLEGRVAGLVTYGNKTMIRGTSSMHAETSPLLVVDGLPIEGKIEDLNPYDIESVTVLKDAAAAAIYGARASNGIIVVTTRRAKEAGTEIDVSANLTIYEKRNMDYHDNFYMNPEEQVEKESAYWEYYFSDRNRDGGLQMAIAMTDYQMNYYLPITPIQYAYYRQAKGMLTQDQLNARLEELKKNNFAREYGEEVLRRQLLQQYNVAIRNRSERFNSNLVLNLRRDNNGIRSSYDNQVNIAYRATYDMKKWLTLNFGITGILQKRAESGSAYAGSPFNVPSYYRLLNEDGSYNYYSPDFNQYYELSETCAGLRTMKFNHLEDLTQDKRTTDRRNIRYQGEMLFKVIDGLTASGSFIYETERQNVSHYSKADSYRMRLLRNIYTRQTGPDQYEYLIPENGGRLTTSDVRGDYWTARAQLNFRRTFADKHTVDFLGGFEFRETRNWGTRGLLLGYDEQLQSHSTMNVNFKELANLRSTTFFCPGYPLTREYMTQINPYIGLVQEEYHHYASGYMNATYTYDNRYNLFGSFRKDYADLFGTNAKFRGKPLWSVGASWNIGRESFMSETHWLNNLKLRASYGVTGNIYQGATSYMTASTYATNRYTSLPMATIDSPANPNLKWEKTSTVNVGVDFALLHGRLRGSLDWYNKKGTDIFSRKSLDISTGFTSMDMNMADMKNNGIELMLSGDWFRPEKEGGLAWTTSVTMAYNKNEITDMEMQNTLAYELAGGSFEKGYPTSGMFSYRYAGLDPEGKPNTHQGMGQPLYWTADGRKVSSIQRENRESVVYSGQADPKFNMALDNTLNYKGFSLNFMMVYYAGHKMRARQYQPMPMLLGVSMPLADYYVDSWTPENTDTDVPGFGEHAYTTSTSSEYLYTDIFVHAADFVKIRNITLGYEVPDHFIRRTGLSNMQVRFQIDNLPALWKKNGVDVDPETHGIRRQMTYMIGLNFKF